MGVKNLWRLLLPAGHRLSIETLSHQTLAVDASIWLTQISKACRDPETGRLLPNRPHVRVFLLRLMRLLYHQIKPVLVFDGVMPEVKRREIERRKNRRERLWRDDEEGSGGGGLLRRTAKKILVKQLKELREKEARLKKKGERDAAGNNKEERIETVTASRSSRGGSFAPGFTIEEDQLPERSAKSLDQTKMKNDLNNGEAISIDSSDDKEQVAQIFQSQIHHLQQHHEEDEQKSDEGEGGVYESDNDWETLHAVQSSISDSIQWQQRDSASSTANPYLKGTSRDDPDENPFDDKCHQRASNEAIASLPSEARSRWIDSQRAARRIQSRKECIRAAAKPDDYSSAQLRNFLRGSELNRRVGEISKLVEGRANGSTTSNPFDESGGGFLAPLPSDEPIIKTPGSYPRAGKKNNEPVLLDYDRDSGAISQNSDDATSINENSLAKEGGIDDNNLVTSMNKRNAGNAFQPSNFLKLATAGQEWEEWGREGAGEGGTKSLESSETKSIDGDASLPSSALESESDISDGLGDTFLSLGRANGIGACSAAVKVAVAQKTGFSIKSTNAGTKNAAGINEEEEEDDDDDIDWEDGDSGDEQLEIMGDTGGDHTNIEIQELSFGDHGNGNSQVLGKDGLISDTSAPAESSKIDRHKDRPKQVADTQYTLDDRNDVIEIPSENTDMQRRENDPRTKERDLPESSQSHCGSEKEPVEINSTDEGPIENEYESFHLNKGTTAALQHAQETASRLTSWAGRAFQRAMMAHVEQQAKADSPSEKKELKEHIELTANDDTINADPSDNRAKNTGLGHKEWVGNDEEQQNLPKRLDLFDTSIGGLNEAHRVILEEEKAMERDMSMITDEMKEEILALLQLCGIPWVESPAEAEAQCAALEEFGLVDGVVTEDSDIFVFGGKKVYKNFFNEQKYVEAYYARDIARDLALRKHQLVALAMLLGGDYTDGVKGVGIVNGMEILQAFTIDDSAQGIQDGLRRFREWLDGFDEPVFDGTARSSKSEEYFFHRKHKSARTRWVAPADFPSQAIINAYLKPVVDTSKARFSWAKPNLNGLQQFCAETLGWEQEETNRVVNPVLKIIERGSKQTRLESYFMRYEDGITFAKVRSKRLKAVLDGIQDDKNPVDFPIEDNAGDGVEREAPGAIEDAKPRRKRQRRK